jgi:hypothetical protein
MIFSEFKDVIDFRFAYISANIRFRGKLFRKNVANDEMGPIFFLQKIQDGGHFRFAHISVTIRFSGKHFRQKVLQMTSFDQKISRWQPLNFEQKKFQDGGHFRFAFKSISANTRYRWKRYRQKVTQLTSLDRKNFKMAATSGLPKSRQLFVLAGNFSDKK